MIQWIRYSRLSISLVYRVERRLPAAVRRAILLRRALLAQLRLDLPVLEGKIALFSKNPKSIFQVRPPQKGSRLPYQVTLLTRGRTVWSDGLPRPCAARSFCAARSSPSCVSTWEPRQSVGEGCQTSIFPGCQKWRPCLIRHGFEAIYPLHHSGVVDSRLPGKGNSTSHGASPVWSTK